MNACLFVAVIINVSTWRDLTNVHAMMVTIWTETAGHAWVSKTVQW